MEPEKIDNTVVRKFTSPADVQAKLRRGLHKWIVAAKRGKRLSAAERRDQQALREHVKSGLRWWRALDRAIAKGDAPKAAWCAVAVCELLAQLNDSYDLIPRHNRLVARVWQQLEGLEKNRNQRHLKAATKAERIRARFAEMTRAEDYVNGFTNLTKRGGIYERLAAEFGLSKSRARTIVTSRK